MADAVNTPIVREILTNHLTRVRDRIAQEMVANNRNASGRSVAGLTIEIRNDNTGILYGGKQYLVMERGKGPGKVPNGFFYIIRKWIIDKGIAVKPIPSVLPTAKLSPYERGLNSMASAIAYNIMKYGTRLHRDHGYNDIYSSAINEELALMAVEILIPFADTISTINKNP